MNLKNFVTHNAWRIVFVAVTLTVGACDAVNEAIDEIDDIGNDADVYYYVSLGTSLSVGVQPNSSGITLPTNDGYADVLFDSIRPAFEAAVANRELRLIKLGCPGETLDDMINGGSCLYLAGSQLAAAVDFLSDNMAKIHLVTIDMGANDFRDANCIGNVNDPNCISDVAAQIATDLATVLTALNDAAGPDTTIIGMNYYNPFLASWLDDLAGQALAMESALAVASVMDVLGTTYATAGIPVADVAAAFQSDEFATLVPWPLPAPNDMVPLNVANICNFTFMCDADPVGPDIHANDAGYSLIADTIELTLEAPLP
jgi:lysophospholipase L1-like esterase